MVTLSALRIELLYIIDTFRAYFFVTAERNATAPCTSPPLPSLAVTVISRTWPLLSTPLAVSAPRLSWQLGRELDEVDVAAALVAGG